MKWMSRVVFIGICILVTMTALRREEHGVLWGLTALIVSLVLFLWMLERQRKSVLLPELVQVDREMHRSTNSLVHSRLSARRQAIKHELTQRFGMTSQTVDQHLIRSHERRKTRR